MAWYYGTFSCGHDGRVNIIGPSKDRQRKADWAFESVCPECKEKAREEARKEAAKRAEEASKEMELPALEGTEKQIAWANTMRAEWAEKMSYITDEDINGMTKVDDRFKGMKLEDLFKVIDFILQNRTQAHYYIEHRRNRIEMVASEIKNALKTEEQLQDEQAFEKLKIEGTVFPEHKVTNAVVEITVTNEKVSAFFEKNEDFRQIVKSLGYKWSGESWEKEISETTGTAADRAAELGNKLLNAGFPIYILDETIRKNAIGGHFEPECKRWIKHRSKTDCFVIHWEGWDDDLYQKARSLPGAKWDSGILVKVSHYAEVEDFARLYGFKFSSGAQKLIDEYLKSLEKVSVVVPSAVKDEHPKDGLKEILESGDEILDDLKD